MKEIIPLIIITLTLTSTLTPPYTLKVSYPQEAFIGQKFNITFSLTTSEINSTNFEYVTPGTKIVNLTGNTAYQGFAGYWMVDKVNISNANQIVVSFTGRIIGTPTGNPGIVLYGSNLNLESTDLQNPDFYAILTALSGTLWLNKLHGWYAVISSLPQFSSGNYTVIFRNINGSVGVYSIAVNNSIYLIKYNTGVPWDNITYIGVRLDTDTLLPLSFKVTSVPENAYYVVYLNGKEYSSGYTNDYGYGLVTLRLYGPATVNITFPQYHIYKVITISSSTSPPPNTDIHEEFPILQVYLLIASIAMVATSLWIEAKGKKKS